MMHLLIHATQRFVRQPAPIARVSVLVVVLLAYGASGFLYFERAINPALTWGEGLWYALVTITTVGYGDLTPETSGGRFVVALPLMFLGISLLGYVLSLSASALVEAKAKELHGMSQVKRHGHVVIVNFPSLTILLRILDELASDKGFGVHERGVVLVDEELEELPPELIDRGVRYVRGNPTRDATLSRAALDDAEYVIVLSKRPGDPHSDDLNVTTTLAIEARHRKVTTVVECVDHATEELLRKAGSDRIVCASRFNARFVSQEVLNPGVQDVIDAMTTCRDGQGVQLSPYQGKALSYAEARECCLAAGHQLLGLRRGEATELNPGDKTPVEPGCQLITVGPSRLRL